jgi:DNA-directed RNA polymerase subunit RPC12/RpoP
MSADQGSGAAAAVTCPHCGKPFTAELLAGDAERHRGFKCPHCKLFVPESRVDDEPAAELEPS